MARRWVVLSPGMPILLSKGLGVREGQARLGGSLCKGPVAAPMVPLGPERSEWQEQGLAPGTVWWGHGMGLGEGKWGPRGLEIPRIQCHILSPGTWAGLAVGMMGRAGVVFWDIPGQAPSPLIPRKAGDSPRQVLSEFLTRRTVRFS